MSSQQDNDKQGNHGTTEEEEERFNTSRSTYKSSLNDAEGLYQDEERQWLLSVITQNMDDDALDQLSNVLIGLVTEIQKEPFGAQHVENELTSILEFVFQRSPVYQLAFELFAARYALEPKDVTVGGIELEDMLKAIKAAKVKGESPCTAPQPRQVSTRLENKEQAATPGADWIERFSEAMAEALESGELPEEAGQDLADVVIKITGDYADDCADHARHLLPVALRRFVNGEPSAIQRVAAQHQEHTEPERKPTEKIAQPQTQNDKLEYLSFDLCTYENTNLFFLLSEGGMKTLSFALHRDSGDYEKGMGFADVFFHTFGDKTTSLHRERVHIPQKKGSKDYNQEIVLSGKGRVDFFGPKDDLIFSLHWNAADNELDGRFEVYEGDNVVQSLTFFQ